MSKLSPHFNRSEFACQCNCGFNTVDAELLFVLEDLREYFDQPVSITSGCRCRSHNLNEGGASTSQHLFGRAADIRVNNTMSSDVYDYLDDKYPNLYGLGLYSGWVHVDTRSKKARW